jgi:hypothetical protein
VRNGSTIQSNRHASHIGADSAGRTNDCDRILELTDTLCHQRNWIDCVFVAVAAVDIVAATLVDESYAADAPAELESRSDRFLDSENLLPPLGPQNGPSKTEVDWIGPGKETTEIIAPSNAARETQQKIIDHFLDNVGSHRVSGNG